MNPWIAWLRNSNLKLGAMEAKDGSPVQGCEVNRQTGRMLPAR
jgi:hypothetical protein|tara:strand:+ start:952 stop:1080 length:129 start_codon:yes stop_codon:yes gene_type:complete